MRNKPSKFNLITRESGLYRTQIPKIVIIILTMRIAAVLMGAKQLGSIKGAQKRLGQ